MILAIAAIVAPIGMLSLAYVIVDADGQSFAAMAESGASARSARHAAKALLNAHQEVLARLDAGTLPSPAAGGETFTIAQPVASTWWQGLAHREVLAVHLESSRIVTWLPRPEGVRPPDVLTAAGELGVEGMLVGHVKGGSYYIRPANVGERPSYPRATFLPTAVPDDVIVRIYYR